MPVRKPSFYNAGGQRQYMSDVLRTKSRGRKFDARRSGYGGYQRARRSGAFLGGSALRAIVTPETKYFDVGINATVTAAGTDWANTEVPCDNYVNSSGVAAAYTDSALIPSAVGSGYGQINGNRYKLKALRIRGAVDISTVTGGSSVSASRTARLLLVMDSQPNGTQAQGEDVMQDIGAAGENEFSFQRVSAVSGRFRILKDLKFMIQPVVASNDATQITTVSTAFRRIPFDIRYAPKVPLTVNITSANSTPTVAGLVTANFFLLLYGGQFTGASAINIQAASRAYYCD